MKYGGPKSAQMCFCRKSSSDTACAEERFTTVHRVVIRGIKGTLLPQVCWWMHRNENCLLRLPAKALPLPRIMDGERVEADVVAINIKSKDWRMNEFKNQISNVYQPTLLVRGLWLRMNLLLLCLDIWQLMGNSPNRWSIHDSSVHFYATWMFSLIATNFCPVHCTLGIIYLIK